jgi:hypothetical protein
MQKLTKIEDLCKKRTEETFGAGLWAGYIVSREKIFDKVIAHISRNEPFLTDHSASHIINVLNNAYDLLGREKCIGNDSTKSLDSAELYFLVLSILFHDVGNVFTRKGHKSRLGEAYEFARGTDQSLLQEKQLLFRIVEAHGGETTKGSSDTIGPLDNESVFKGKRVDCQRVAAILRLADELAEGAQRTSLFMQKYLPYPEDSEVFHDYANVTDINIGREQGRIAVVYQIEMAPETWGAIYNPQRLRKLLEFCYHRLYKLDLERKYNRHYCSMLTPFKKTEASFHFHFKGRDLRLELPKLVLDDLILPNSIKHNPIETTYPDYQLDRLMPRLADLTK